MGDALAVREGAALSLCLWVGCGVEGAKKQAGNARFLTPRGITGLQADFLLLVLPRFVLFFGLLPVEVLLSGYGRHMRQLDFHRLQPFGLLQVIKIGTLGIGSLFERGEGRYPADGFGRFRSRFPACVWQGPFPLGQVPVVIPQNHLLPLRENGFRGFSRSGSSISCEI